MSLSTIKEATNQDPVLQFLRECIIKTNCPKVSMMRPYYGIRHELTIVDDIIVRGSLDANRAPRTNFKAGSRRAPGNGKDKDELT